MTQRWVSTEAARSVGTDRLDRKIVARGERALAVTFIASVPGAPKVLQDLVPTALDLLAEYGTIVLFVLLVLDNAGIPFPTELVLIMAVGLFVTDTLSLVFLVALATAAALVGSLLLYGVCYKGGRRLVEKYPKLFMMNPRRLERLERVFGHKIGKSLVFFLRLIPITRVLVSIPAGVARMRPVAFLVLTFLGMTIYHVVLVVLAYRFGSAMGDGPSLDAAVSNPAWQYIQTNQVLTFLVLLALGLLLSLKASRSTLKDPEWASPSKIGWIAERIAVFGGLGLFVLVLVDVGLVFQTLAFFGLDLTALAQQMNWDAASFLIVVAVVSLIAGVPTLLYARAARKRKWVAWLVEHGMRGTAQVITKPASATAMGQQLKGRGAKMHMETLRSSPKDDPKPEPSVTWADEETGNSPAGDRKPRRDRTKARK